METATDFDADTLKNFGKMQISFMDGGEDVTESKTPSKITLTAAKKSVMYSSVNAVVSKASATAIADVFDNTKAGFRSSIVMPSSGTIDLVFLLTTTYAQ